MSNRIRSKTKRTVGRNKMPAPSAHSRYSAATQQIIAGSATLARMLGLVDPVGDTRELERQQRLEPILRELEAEVGASARSAILGRLLAYLNPLEQARLDEATRRLPDYQTIVREELEARDRLLRYLQADFSIRPLPRAPLDSLKQDCEEARQQLSLLLHNLKIVSTILKKAEAASLDRRIKKTKPQRRAARRAELSLVKFFLQQGISRREAAAYTHKIIEAWEPTAASSKESIRTASIQRSTL